MDGGEEGDWLAGGDDDDILSGAEGNDILYGGAGRDLLNGGKDNDSLIGGQGEDTLVGGAGHDIIQGGPGDDYLTGGDGNDLFYYQLGRDGTDTITDFTARGESILSLGDTLVLYNASSGLDINDIVTYTDGQNTYLFVKNEGDDIHMNGDGIILQGVALPADPGIDFHGNEAFTILQMAGLDIRYEADLFPEFAEA